jgi:hypothetical protein
MRSRIAHHLDFPDFNLDELMKIAEMMLAQQEYHFDKAALEAFQAYLIRRMTLPNFANGRSVRNAIDRIKLRSGGTVTKEDLARIDASDILKSRVFAEVPELDDLSESPTRQT